MQIISESEALRGIITSLYYLAKEAETAELGEVSRIIRQALDKTEQWASGNGGNIYTLVASDQTYSMLMFLHEFLQSSAEGKKDFLDAIASVCEGRTRIFDKSAH